MERHRSPSASFLVVLALVLFACGEEAPRETPPSTGLTVSGPAARWRRSVDVADGGHPAVIEALKPCRVTFRWRLDAVVEGRESKELSPGEAFQVRTSGEAVRPPDAPVPPDAARARGRTRASVFSLRYVLDSGGNNQRTDVVWTRDREPWSRIVSAAVPPTWMDLPTGVEIPLLALGVSDAADVTGLRLDLSSPPRIASPRPFAPDDLVHVASLSVLIETR